MKINSDFLPIVNSYSTSDKKIYSANYVNNIAIYDYGQDATNGWWIRLGNGIMIQWHRISTNTIINSAWGNVYTSSRDSGQTYIWYFPKDFVTGTQPYVFASSYGSGTAWMLNWQGAPVASMHKQSSQYIFARGQAIASSQTYAATFLAIGRWK